jgi:phosphatidylinositol-3-phosphatase
MTRAHRFLLFSAAILGASLATACGSSSSDDSKGPAISAIPDRPCGRTTPPPRKYRHVVWIVMENKGYDDVIGSDNAPYITALSRACGAAARFFAETHPSAPNYIAMTSGGTQGLHNDADPIEHPIHAPSIFSELGSGGWRALAEFMPSNCRRKFKLPDYYARHNAPAYYPNIRSDCLKYDQPLRGKPDLSARFTFIAPGSCHSMHTCDVSAGDAWLEQFMPKAFSSAEYRARRTAVFLTWEESDGDGNRIPTLVMAPTVPKRTISDTRFDHYSLLRTTQELLGLRPFLGRAATARSMRDAFRL